MRCHPWQMSGAKLLQEDGRALGHLSRGQGRIQKRQQLRHRRGGVQVRGVLHEPIVDPALIPVANTKFPFQALTPSSQQEPAMQCHPMRMALQVFQEGSLILLAGRHGGHSITGGSQEPLKVHAPALLSAGQYQGKLLMVCNARSHNASFRHRYTCA